MAKKRLILKPTGKRKTTTTKSPCRIKEVTRKVKEPVCLMLWGRAAGRCEFGGCNKPLWKSTVTQELVNIAQKAHIWAFSSDGPRGNKGIPKKKLNELNNLLLVCHECHQKIDKERDGGKYTVALLQSMKAEHERRIEIVTGVHPKKKSQIVLYWSNIGDHPSLLNYADTAEALFPLHYPVDDRPIFLGTPDSTVRDLDSAFWTREVESLKFKFEQRVRVPYGTRGIPHLSVFALAPQPLLILLGTLMTDIPKGEVFQLHREPQGWKWPARARAPDFQVIEPMDTTGAPALVLSMSGSITDDRIKKVLGDKAAIWTVTIPKPNNDFTKSRRQLAEFRALMRPLLDKIKSVHGQTAPLNIFPATSVAIAVELGRVRMPKADMTWLVYDQVNKLGGFIPAIKIEEQETNNATQQGAKE
jgi:SMODS-associated and fused to various effectors sensor domain